MGMFDTVVCRIHLPGTPRTRYPDYEDFQTKDLACQLDTFIIETDGRLINERGFLFRHNGVITFKGQIGGERRAFDAHFADGRLVHLVIHDDSEDRSAWEAGYKAHADGLPIVANPYYGDGNAENWNEGWLADQEEAAEK